MDDKSAFFSAFPPSDDHRLTVHDCRELEGRTVGRGQFDETIIRRSRTAEHPVRRRFSYSKFRQPSYNDGRPEHSLLTISFGESAIQDGKVELFVSDSIVSQLGAQRIIPQPQSTVIGTGGLTYTFPALSAGTVRLELRPDGAGVYRYDIKTRAGDSLRAKVWVMP